MNWPFSQWETQRSRLSYTFLGDEHSPGDHIVNEGLGRKPQAEPTGSGGQDIGGGLSSSEFGTKAVRFYGGTSLLRDLTNLSN